MNLQTLITIEEELNRFTKRLNEAIIAAEENKGHTYYGSDEKYGTNEIGGTAISGL